MYDRVFIPLLIQNKDPKSLFIDKFVLAEVK